MSYDKIRSLIEQQLAEIRAAGLYKTERVLLGPQGGSIRVAQGTVINLCANNDLGLADHQAIVGAAAQAVRTRGYGMASVRFICGTQDLHKDLEHAITSFLGTGDTILYSSCFDANTGLFETVLGEEDAVLSDALNHASVIDGIRLCKAQRYRYAHGDMADLEKGLRETAGRRIRLIATDGVFSMDGDLARLDAVVELAERYGALVMVDDSHAALAVQMADRLLEEGVYVTGFSYPVVPKGEARIRVQVSAAHTREQLAQAVTAFEKVGHELGVTS